MMMVMMMMMYTMRMYLILLYIYFLKNVLNDFFRVHLYLDGDILVKFVSEWFWQKLRPSKSHWLLFPRYADFPKGRGVPTR